MATADDAARFAAAKRSPAYREAMDSEPPRGSLPGTFAKLVAAAVLLAGLAIVTVAMGLWLLAIFIAVMWLALVVMVVRDRSAKPSWLLAIVNGEGAQAIGDAYGGPVGMGHFLILRGEDGTERTLSADPMAAAGLSKGDLGVATIRGGRVVAFAQITPPADGA